MSRVRHCLNMLKKITHNMHNPPTDKTQLGHKGEDVAARYIKNLGLRIIERNWRYKQWELDIICRDKHTLVFVEVKTRTVGSMATPLDAITARKRHALIHAATAWLSIHDAWSHPCRFDVVAVVCHKEKNQTTFSVEHYPHAFDFSQTMDSSHSSWQPW